MTATEQPTKICERKACGQPYHPAPGSKGQRWTRRRYCSNACASAARVDPYRGKGGAVTPGGDPAPAVPVAAGETWRPAGFPAVPDHRARAAIKTPVRVIDDEGGEES